MKIAAVVALLASLLTGSPTHATVTYPASSETFANPERGFYHHTGDCDSTTFDEATLRSYRTSQSISLVMCIFYLRQFKTSPISASALAHLQSQLDTVRRAGLKVVLRFAYTDADNVDATPAQVSAHLDQLAPTLRTNADVIAVVQAGLIGTWGEWWYTQHFGDEGVLTDQNWRDRRAVTDKLLSVVPTSRAIQVRTPTIKRTMYGTGRVARIGHHNDCFLASPDDYGTYENPAVEYPYLQDDTLRVPMGGETCTVNPPRSDCPTATAELAGFHWSYLNTDYNRDVLNSWSPCIADVTRKLGYRFALTSGTYPASAVRGGSLPVTIGVRNDGYAAPYNPRDARLVLRNTSSGVLTRLALDTDPRTWAAGTTASINQSVTVPSSLAAGQYQLYLELPDPLLPSRPEYSIRLANQNTWDAATGLNNLNATVTVR
ncbi:DUF4832 domain-containing protein [Actinoplanes sp. N902-109]|uniref:DUF4832 domain-containing protein n=1 Tax=Actinoplanes sp. (strain N902-109) TaxID=649831 RepID=UPI0003295D70|nr:DUF4832 domain-containing protein [Actinoplanes sp. N902-109]AGL16129.1 hypothetical protein L083_2619 [Actinoplanes sp. N902-109]